MTYVEDFDEEKFLNVHLFFVFMVKRRLWSCKNHLSTSLIQRFRTPTPRELIIRLQLHKEGF